MPKTGIFDDMITFSSFLELREKITAIQFMRGDRVFADTARGLMYAAVEAEIKNLKGTDLRTFNEILQNAKFVTKIRKQQLAERNTGKSPG